MKKNPLKGYFIFTKKEKRGTLFILFIVVLVFMGAKYIYPLIIKNDVEDPALIVAIADSLKEIREVSNDIAGYNKGGSTTNYPSYPNRGDKTRAVGELFYFDPNTLDVAGWQRLGIKEKTIATIRNYLYKGGKFREADDIKKIWGLREEEKDRLLPYVRIPAMGRNSGGSGGSFKPYERKEYEKPVYEKKIPQAVDINSGDSADYVSLPGIGPGFSKRILNFREKLGGFYQVEQVGETFGLPDSVFQKIKPLLKISGTDIRKININTATNEELKAHPYIRWQLANVITEFKKQHGNFKSAEDLKKIMILNSETINKLSPYLEY